MKKRIITAVVLLAGMGAMAVGVLPQPGLLAAQVRGNVVEVATPSALNNAVSWARPGSTIRLAPGDYPRLDITRSVAGEPIRITGPREARINQLLFLKARGWRVDGVTLVGGAGKAMPLDIAFSNDIMLTGVRLTGATRDPGPREEASNGMVIRNSESIVFALGEADHLKQIASIRDSWGVVIEGNRFTNAREGLMVRATHGLVIRHNLFQGWAPRYDLYEHPDMIQFFTQQTPTGSTMVTIEGNYLSAGLDRIVQGIFVRAEAYEDGRAPLGYHRDFTIRHNVYFGSSHHGISVSNTRGVVIENNTVIGSPHAFVGNRPRDPTGRSSVGWQPTITVAGLGWGRVANNISPLLAIRSENGRTQNENNFVYRPRVPEDGANPGQTFGRKLAAGEPPLSAFKVTLQSENGKSGRGADVNLVGPDAAIRDTAALMREAVQRGKAAHRQDLSRDQPLPD